MGGVTSAGRTSRSMGARSTFAYERAVKWYQRFKMDVVGRLEHDQWTLTSVDVIAALHKHQES